jgi:hypothetical protein
MHSWHPDMPPSCYSTLPHWVFDCEIPLTCCSTHKQCLVIFVLPQSLAAYNHPRFLTYGVIISKAVLLHVDHRSILSFSVRSRDLSSCSALILFLVHSSILSMITPLNLSYSLANSRGYISLLLALSLRLHVASQPNSADEIAGVTDFGNWLRLMGSTAQAT